MANNFMNLVFLKIKLKLCRSNERYFTDGFALLREVLWVSSIRTKKTEKICLIEIYKTKMKIHSKQTITNEIV